MSSMSNLDVVKAIKRGQHKFYCRILVQARAERKVYFIYAEAPPKMTNIVGQT